MSCYRPLLAKFIGSSDGKPSYKVVGSWTGFVDDPRDISVPCGHCIGCRLDKSRQWADRMMLELDHSKKAVFLTLTYDDLHVPISMINDDDSLFFTLDKRDVQLFFKRLRKHRRFRDFRIRYYLAGEYGDTTQRPHYHAIIFGIDLDDIGDCKQFGKNPFGQPYFISDTILSIWGKGFISLAPVSWQTCAYVARYCTKKLDGDMGIVYAFRNCAPPFALMSRCPGIGGFFARDHPELLSETYQYIDDMHGVRNVRKVPTPKYLFDKLRLTNPQLYDSIKTQRTEYAHDKLLIELSKTDLDLFEYNKVRELNKQSVINSLPRNSI